MTAGKVNAAEAARIVGVSERTMRAWLTAGKIEGAVKQDTPDGPERQLGQPAMWEIDPASLAKFAQLTQRAQRSAPGEMADGDVNLTERVAALEHLVKELRDRLEKQTMSKAILSATPIASPLPAARWDAGERGPVERASLPAPVPALTARAPRHTMPLRWHGGGLPDGLVNWRTFAELHHIPERTVRFMIDKGRLTLVEGKWKRDNYYIRSALDATGRRRFFELWGTREDFRPCPQCPHDNEDHQVDEDEDAP